MTGKKDTVKEEKVDSSEKVTNSYKQATKMEGLKPPRNLNANASNMADEWKTWKTSFELYMMASGGDEKEDKVKIAVLLHVAGEETQKAFAGLSLTDAEKKVFATVMEAIEGHYAPQTNNEKSVQSFTFHRRPQGTTETFDTFVTDLKTIAKKCQFGAAEDRMLVDQIIQGVKDIDLQKRLLMEENLTLKKALEMGRAAEKVHEQLEIVKKDAEAVNQITSSYKRQGQGAERRKQTRTGNYNMERTPGKQGQRPERQGQQGRRPCSKCGLRHEMYKCPAFGAQCYKCEKQNHFARMCKGKKVSEIEQSESSSDESMFSITCVSAREKAIIKNERVCVAKKKKNYVRSRNVKRVDTVNDNSWYEKITLKEINRKVKFKLDTGAQVNVLPLKVLKNCNIKIKPSRVTLKTYTNARIPVVGKVELTGTVNNITRVTVFQVVDKTDVCAILGLKDLKNFELVIRNANANVMSINKNTIYAEYKELFKGIGCVKIKPCHITLKENTIPQVSACRKIPFKLKAQVKEELDRMEKLNLITKVTEPTDWVNPITVVSKKNTNIRICLDPSHLNKAIKREHFKLPTFEELTADLSEATVFATLDANKGFHQIPLNHESSLLTTFITPFGRYRFLRLPFGISNAPEIFHATFNTVFGGIPGVKVYIDDLLLYAKNKEELKKYLKWY